MNLFEIELSTKAQRDLNRLNSSVCNVLASELKKLAISPFPKKKYIKKIKGTKHPIYRMRVETRADSFRIFYTIVHPNTVLVLRIVSKKDAERIIKKLK